MQAISNGSCGSGSCGCGAPAAAEFQSSEASAPDARGAAVSATTPHSAPPASLAPALYAQSPQPSKVQAPRRINGIALVAPVGADADTDTDWLELARTELLRQEAVSFGLLTATSGTTAPELSESDRTVIETMVDAAINTPKPTSQECERFYEANKPQFVIGQTVHVRHILFAVTPGVNVHALAVHAENALLSLLGKEVPVDQFVRLARELSNCPTSTRGGDLGWIGPNDCAPELANELFLQKDSQWCMGVHPRLIHSRFGFHILDTLGRRNGQQKTFAEVHERIATQLTQQSRARALHQYMRLLVGQAKIEGIEMNGAASPLVQ